jgi:transcriptional regulator GlxA family with amidase domain
MSATEISHCQLRIGVLMVGVNQLLDIAPVDLLGMLSKDYLSLAGLPTSIQDHGLNVEIQYISDTGGFHGTTAGAALRVTHLLESPHCAPGKLDILLLPGSDAFTPTENVLKFVQGHSAAQGTTILAICTGTFTGAHAGIFDGKIATGPRAFYKELRQQFPLVKWVDHR